MNFIYNGIEYTNGTKVRIQTRYNGKQIMTYNSDRYVSEFVSDNPTVLNVKVHPPYVNTINIVEIIEPVYPHKEEMTSTYYRQCPSLDTVFVGWVWYIVIMLIGIIFKDRLLIWVFATAVFFLWKNGFLNGGNK